MKILMLGHSYVVTLNRRLFREVARAGGDRVSVTVAAPASFPGDLGPIRLEIDKGEPYALEPVPEVAREGRMKLLVKPQNDSREVGSHRLGSRMIREAYSGGDI